MATNIKKNKVLYFLNNEINNDDDDDYNEINQEFFLKNNMNWSQLKSINSQSWENENTHFNSDPEIDYTIINPDFYNNNLNSPKMIVEKKKTQLKNYLNKFNNKAKKNTLNKRRYEDLLEEYTTKKKNHGLSMMNISDDDVFLFECNEQYKNKYGFEFCENYKNTYIKPRTCSNTSLDTKINILGNGKIINKPNIFKNYYVGDNTDTTDDSNYDLDDNNNNNFFQNIEIDNIYGSFVEDDKSSFILTKNMKKKFKNFLEKKKRKIDRNKEYSINLNYNKLYGGNKNSKEIDAMYYKNEYALNSIHGKTEVVKEDQDDDMSEEEEEEDNERINIDMDDFEKNNQSSYEQTEDNNDELTKEKESDNETSEKHHKEINKVSVGGDIKISKLPITEEIDKENKINAFNLIKNNKEPRSNIYNLEINNCYNNKLEKNNVFFLKNSDKEMNFYTPIHIIDNAQIFKIKTSIEEEKNVGDKNRLGDMIENIIKDISDETEEKPSTDVEADKSLDSATPSLGEPTMAHFTNSDSTENEKNCAADQGDGKGKGHTDKNGSNRSSNSRVNNSHEKESKDSRGKMSSKDIRVKKGSDGNNDSDRDDEKEDSEADEREDKDTDDEEENEEENDEEKEEEDKANKDKNTNDSERSEKSIDQDSVSNDHSDYEKRDNKKNIKKTEKQPKKRNLFYNNMSNKISKFFFFSSKKKSESYSDEYSERSSVASYHEESEKSYQNEEKQNQSNDKDEDYRSEEREPSVSAQSEKRRSSIESYQNDDDHEKVEESKVESSEKIMDHTIESSEKTDDEKVEESKAESSEKTMDDQIDDQMDDQIDDQMDDQIDDQMDDQIDDQMDDQVDDQIDDQMDDQVDDQIDDDKVEDNKVEVDRVEDDHVEDDQAEDDQIEDSKEIMGIGEVAEKEDPKVTNEEDMSTVNDESMIEKNKAKKSDKKAKKTKHTKIKKESSNSSDIISRTCNICNAVFVKSILMQRHLKSVHSDERPYECDVCFKRYKRPDHLKLHQMKHTASKNDKKYECPTCHSVYLTLRQLDSCKLKHLKNPNDSTTDNNEGTTTVLARKIASSLKRSNNINDGTNNILENISQKNINELEEKKHDENELNNDEIENGENHIESLENKNQEEGENNQIDIHNNINDSINMPEIKREAPEHNSNIPVEIRTCNVCSMVFANKKLMKRHLMSVHTDSRPYKCELCLKTYKRSDHLKKHILTHEDNKVKTKYKCAICQVEFDTPKELKEHKIRHYQCPYANCSYHYSTISNMKYHLNKHKCNLYYSCPVCNEQFYIYKEFIQHKRSCFKKKYVCLQCNKIYLHSNGYNKHIKKVHLKIFKNYKCTINNCYKEFASEFSLKEHIINFHHHVKRFFCSECNISFGYRSSYRRHNVNVHS
ncbi:C2H2 zinc finger protein Zfp, putative [Plasmodium chabaudi chabaudi]|uniref:Telomere repeat-binding zinc finger protein, putative n=1 Tax=Plasmodium chabaudi chabaudi TaxID=31271 RepID=A0A4V0K454_PLACU|nr:C2H2 zinc finger protein Zfp, putative [Plasmodium chabaudi chabaudi]VTZ67691.1 C2H2 zinc finger protein Zfp, putative [Plasmodium chabaudi chabaudi]|eukprot:XP_741660.2 zinc finger transcription factor, putative [Plasmodium chabaudi chabaudi]